MVKTRHEAAGWAPFHDARCGEILGGHVAGERSWERGAAMVTSEFGDLGDDRVLSLGEWSGTGEASGAQTSIPLAGVWTLKAGKITHVRWFFDQREALEAVGLHR